jgi:hypothetical protein
MAIFDNEGKEKRKRAFRFKSLAALIPAVSIGFQALAPGSGFLKLICAERLSLLRSSYSRHTFEPFPGAHRTAILRRNAQEAQKGTDMERVMIRVKILYDSVNRTLKLVGHEAKTVVEGDALYDLKLPVVMYDEAELEEA